ncbi:hypothetical protein Taro_042146 [Colocasia esculenta]|uniref:Uncharacterized protein n=1 Tax=Colocasia esculenta TaxID=4460 RepID=A0A843WNQ3_COLES|nr:hypothetical protein [Colocasia esculenta]
MRAPPLNRLVQVVSENYLTDISIVWWKRNHNAHHVACNKLDIDPDLQHIPLFAVSSKFFHSLRSYFYEMKMDFDAVAKFLMSYQHWMFYLVMYFARINLLAHSILLLFSKKKVPNRG